jgi:hypothetical protein
VGMLFGRLRSEHAKDVERADAGSSTGSS